MKTITTAQDYIARGWAPLPVPHRKKAPVVKGWQHLRIDDSNVDQHFNGHLQNIGVLLGEPSGWLVDVDLDHQLAVAMAPDFLPPSASRFGRASKPESHILYRVTAPINTTKFQTVSGMIVEVRSTGCQTVFPGSVHEGSGETIEWAEDGEPLEISPDDLLECVRNLAEAVALALGEPLKGGAPSPSPAPAPSPRPQIAGGKSAMERCIKYLATIPPGISGQGGHKATFYAACICLRFGLGEAEAWQAMESFNARCQPPWTATELEHKLNDARKVVAADNKVGVMLESRPTSFKTPPPTGDKPDDLHLTDLGTSERFDDEHGRDLRYCPPLGEWFVYDGRRWAPDTTMEVERRAAQTVRRLYALAATIADSGERAAVVAFAKASEKRERLAAVPALARQRLAVSPDHFDRDTLKLNVENGTINLRDGNLLHHDRDDLLTCIAPVVFDPAAECPLWLAFLHRVMAGNDGMVAYLQRLCGYFLTGETRDQIFPVAHGEGANGKSVFVDTIMGILGDYSKIAPDSLLTASTHDSHPTEIAMLKGARLVVGSETEEGRKLKVQQVKRMTGDNCLIGRKMKKDFFEFTRTHKTMLVTNNKPTVTESKNAIWRRIRLIPFTVRIPVEEQDQQLLQKLRREWSGILAWMVRGCLEWQRIGLSDPPEVGLATDDYRQEQDRIAAFVDDCLYPINNTNWSSRKAVREAYVQWAHRTGERQPLEAAGLYDRLVDIEGIQEKFGTENGKRTRGFSGVALLPGGGE